MELPTGSSKRSQADKNSRLLVRRNRAIPAVTTGRWGVQLAPWGRRLRKAAAAFAILGLIGFGATPAMAEGDPAAPPSADQTVSTATAPVATDPAPAAPVDSTTAPAASAPAAPADTAPAATDPAGTADQGGAQAPASTDTAQQGVPATQGPSADSSDTSGTSASAARGAAQTSEAAPDPPASPAPPYLRWRAVDEAGVLISGVHFTAQGPRNLGVPDDGADAQWAGMPTSEIVDNTGAADYVGADLDPAAGAFLVKQLTDDANPASVHDAAADEQFRIRPSVAQGEVVLGEDAEWTDVVVVNAIEAPVVDAVLRAPAPAPQARGLAAEASDAPVVMAAPPGAQGTGGYDVSKDNLSTAAWAWKAVDTASQNAQFIAGSFTTSVSGNNLLVEFQRPSATGAGSWAIEYTNAPERWGNPNGLGLVPQPDRSQGGQVIFIGRNGNNPYVVQYCTYTGTSYVPTNLSTCTTLSSGVLVESGMTVKLQIPLSSIQQGSPGCPPTMGSTAYVRSFNNNSSPSSNLQNWAAPVAFAPPSTCPTIVMMKGDIRSALSSSGINVNATYVVGARFGLYASSTSTTPVATCTITDAAQGCRFPNVTQTGQLWVGELAPEAGSPAALNYSAPLGTLTTSNSDGDVFTNRNYRYATPTITSSTTGTITLPEASGDNTGGDWAVSSRRYANRLNNPTLTQTCQAGMKVALVMDLSGSVAASGAADTLQDAATAFVDSLTGSGSSVALFSFGDASPRAGTSNQATPLNVDTQRAQIDTIIDNYRAYTVTDQGTNWDAGLWAAGQGAASNDYDVVFVLTDGNPTFSGTSPDGSGRRTTFRELERSVFSANVIKAAGSRVITVGIGGNLSNYNLAAVSGPSAFAAGDGFNDFDYVNTDWNALETLLSDFAKGLSCRADITVTKLAGNQGDTPAPASGWTFGAAASSGTLSPSGTQQTGVDGTAAWALTFPTPGATGTVTLTETQSTAGGWELSGVSCTVNGANVPVTSGLVVSITGVAVGDTVNCTYTNVRRPSSTVEATKTWIVQNGDGSSVVFVTHEPLGSEDLITVPPGWVAQLKLTGPGSAGATNQDWGDARGGYFAGGTVGLSETVTIDSATYPGCLLMSQRVTKINGQTPEVVIDLSGSNTFTATLVSGANTFEVTNTVRCATTMTLLKHVVGGDTPANTWNLVSDPDGSGPSRTVPGSESESSVGPNSNTFEVTPGLNHQVREELADPSDNPAYLFDRLERCVPAPGGCNWVEVDGSLGVSVALGQHGIYRFVNRAAPAIEVPLTGGMSADLFIFGGLGIALFAMMSAAGYWRRSQRQAEAQ